MIKSFLSDLCRVSKNRGFHKSPAALMFGGLISCGLIMGSTSAFSNIPTPADKITNVYTRFNPAYDPQGIRVGNLIFSSSLQTSIAYSDNIYASNDPKSDLIYTVRPSVNLVSDFVRHRIALNANAQKAWYKKYDSENYTD